MHYVTDCPARKQRDQTLTEKASGNEVKSVHPQTPYQGPREDETSTYVHEPQFPIPDVVQGEHGTARSRNGWEATFGGVRSLCPRLQLPAFVRTTVSPLLVMAESLSAITPLCVPALRAISSATLSVL